LALRGSTDRPRLRLPAALLELPQTIEESGSGEKLVPEKILRRSVGFRGRLAHSTSRHRRIREGSKPTVEKHLIGYQQIPFQFSLHIVGAAGANPEHRKFLAEGKNDPRPEFMRQLKSAIEPAGSIVVFNAAFEKGRLNECAELFPECGKWISVVNSRMVDLLNPFKAFNFYHPDQCGSASLKSVLPALTGKDYEHLEIQEGGMASLEFLRVTFTNVGEAERKRVRRALDGYCSQDTVGMIWILDSLRNHL